jgi:SSS family solute:Na+ symporter
MILSFAVVILLSLALALASKRGHAGQDARAFFVASGQLGALLVFFLSVGETYSVASMLGYPGGVYAHGDGFSAWFFGYILMIAPVIFFLGPWIARAGRLYSCATISDFFARHFESRSLELVVTAAAIIVLVPVGTMQFLGLKIVLMTLAPDAPPLLLIAGAGLLAFFYVAIAGLRASAYIAVLKDLLMIGSILLVSGVALVGWRHGLTAQPSVPEPPITTHDMRFAASTILVQSAGYAMLPQTWSFLFSARSADAIRRSQVAAPIYMIMFPLLMCVATYALFHGLHPSVPDQVFLTTAATLLPHWLLGVVLAGVTLAGLVLLSTVCLAIGSLATRNLASGLGETGQKRGAKIVTALYLFLSIVSAESSGHLMATMNNIIYFGIVQTLPGLIAALRFRRTPAMAVIGGIIIGDVVALAIFASGVDVGGLNPGLIGLVPNVITLIVLTACRPRQDGRTVLEKLRDADLADGDAGWAA